MNYVTFYPKAENVHLIKDVGMIPSKLKELCGVEAKLVCYDNGPYSYLDENEFLKIDFIEKRHNNEIIDGCNYLRKNSKNIDILQLFHVTLSSIFFLNCYKHFNKKGKCYIKLDCSFELLDKIKSLSTIKRKLFNMFFNKLDLISVEQEEILIQLKKLFPKIQDKFIPIPNGVDYGFLQRKNIFYNYKEKENIILSVARIGAPEKNTEMLVEAFSNIKNIERSGWKLILIGEVSGNFEKFIKNTLENKQELKKSIEILGPIYDREKLFNEYRKAKIFSLTSDFESFGIAFIEAASLGDVIISTNVGISTEIVNKSSGKLVEIRNVDALRKALEEFINCESLEDSSYRTYQLCKEKFDWDKIIIDLNNNLNNQLLLSK